MNFAEWLYQHRPTPTNAIFWRWRKAEAERKALKEEVRLLKAALRESRTAVRDAHVAVSTVMNTHERTRP